MKFYKYVGKDQRNFACRGSIRAKDEVDAFHLLKKQGIVVDSIEADYDANARMKPATISKLSSGVKKPGAFNEVLSYAMPVGAILVALAGIPLMLNLVKPPAPEKEPTQVIQEYFNFESRQAYKKQFELLSKSSQELFETAEKYERRKKRWFTSEDGKNLGMGKLLGVEQIEKEIRRVEYEIKLLRVTGVGKLNVSLILSKGEWRIEAVKDPLVLEYYLNLLYSTPKEDQKVKYTRELKNITGYSDLEIEGALKKYTWKREDSNKKW